MSRTRKRKKRRSIPVQPPGSPPKKSENRLDNSSAWGRVPLVIGVVLVLTSGVLHGLQTSRWTQNTDLSQAAARLQQVPIMFGDWEGHDLETDQTELDRAGAEGFIHRVYHNRVTGEEVIVMLLCGSHGPIALHPPTVCFVGAGWKLEQEPKRESLTGGEGNTVCRLQVARFRKEMPDAVIRMRACWAWNSTGKWLVPDRPRFAFASADYLFKLYVTSKLPTGNDSTSDPSFDNSPCSRFLQTFLPVLTKANI